MLTCLFSVANIIFILTIVLCCGVELECHGSPFVTLPCHGTECGCNKIVLMLAVGCKMLVNIVLTVARSISGCKFHWTAQYQYLQ